MTQRFDVAIVGAGPGGSAAAHYLAQRGVSVLLLDKSIFPRDKTCGDGLTPRAVGMLQDMGLLGALSQHGQRINRFEVVAPNRRTTQSPIPASDTLPAFSYVLPRFTLDDSIRQRALSSGARFESGVSVESITSSAAGVQLRCKAAGTQVTFDARLAVIATGANTALLTRLGILSKQPDTMIAARAYFDDVAGLSDIWQLRFDGVPLPGYGWIFPTGPRSANIGAGYFLRKPGLPASAVFEQFVAGSAVREMLRDARQTGPLKSYPLRADFTTAPTYAERIFLVGEAAGLVNPLTGEGIDYALESGRIAATHMAGMLADGDFSTARYRAYDAELRAHFQSLFEFCMFVRDHLCDKAWLLNTLVAVANRRADLRTKLASVVLGGRAISGKLTAGRVLRAVMSQDKKKPGTQVCRASDNRSMVKTLCKSALRPL